MNELEMALWLSLYVKAVDALLTAKNEPDFNNAVWRLRELQVRFELAKDMEKV